MLSKNERKLLGKLSPIFIALLNEENMAFTFTYFSGVQASVIGSDWATLKMEKEVRENPSWVRVFKADKKSQYEEGTWKEDKDSSREEAV